MVEKEFHYGHNSIIFLGERVNEKEHIFNGRPSFYDALKLSDQPPPIDVELPYQIIPLPQTTIETYHFQIPNLSKKIKCSFHPQSLKMIESDQSLTTSTVYNVFNHFLIKKGTRVLFLTEVPHDKTKNRRKDGSNEKN